LSIIFVLIYN